MYRGEKPLETDWRPSSTLEDVAKHAVDFWLSPRTCRAREPSDAERRRQGQLSYRPTIGEPTAALDRIKGMLSSLGMQATT